MNTLAIRIFHIYVLVTYTFHVKEILNRTTDLNLILVKVFLFVTGILIAFLRIILLKYHF